MNAVDFVSNFRCFLWVKRKNWPFQHHTHKQRTTYWFAIFWHIFLDFCCVKLKECRENEKGDRRNLKHVRNGKSRAARRLQHHKAIKMVQITRSYVQPQFLWDEFCLSVAGMLAGLLSWLVACVKWCFVAHDRMHSENNNQLSHARGASLHGNGEVTWVHEHVCVYVARQYVITSLQFTCSVVLFFLSFTLFCKIPSLQNDFRYCKKSWSNVFGITAAATAG